MKQTSTSPRIIQIGFIFSVSILLAEVFLRIAAPEELWRTVHEHTLLSGFFTYGALAILTGFELRTGHKALRKTAKVAMTVSFVPGSVIFVGQTNIEDAKNYAYAVHGRAIWLMALPSFWLLALFGQTKLDNASH